MLTPLRSRLKKDLKKKIRITHKSLETHYDYSSPVKGLYICGSSTHPGGGVMGAPGANAARTILRSLSKNMHMKGYAA